MSVPAARLVGRMRVSIPAALAVLSVASSAFADPASDAKDLFERGRILRAAGKCDEAAPLFEKAAEIFPAGLGSLRNAAECEEALGHFATSHRLWNDLKRGVMLSKEERYQGWQAEAEAAAARLEPKLAHVTVDVVESDGKSEHKLSPKNKVTVKLGDDALPLPLVGTLLDRDPGKYVVTVTGADGVPKSETVELRVGDAKTLRFVVPAPPPEPVDRGPTGPSGPVDDHGAATRRTIGWVGVGVGAAGLATGGVFWALTATSVGRMVHPEDQSDPRYADYRSFAERLRPRTNSGQELCVAAMSDPSSGGAHQLCDEHLQVQRLALAFGIGGAAVTLGGALIVATAPTSTPASLRLTGWFNGGGGGVLAEGNF